MYIKKRNEPSMCRGIIMFSLLLTAYVVFVTNWVAGSNLSKQITQYFFNGETVSPIISEVVNYTITIARIIANLSAAYVLIKLNPKKAAIFALICLSFSFIAIFTPNYWVYVVARMVMTLGGSMLMIFVNTYVAQFIPPTRRMISSAFITASYNIGAGLVAILFFIFKDYFIVDWQRTMMYFSVPSILLLVTWLFISQDFEVVSKQDDDTNTTAHYTFKEALKDKFVYIFAIGFGGFLFLYVMSLVSLPNAVANAANNGFRTEIMILMITTGGILGTILNLFIGHLHFKRKPFLLLHGVSMILTMLLAIYLSFINLSLAYMMYAVVGFIMASQYPVYLNYPYELPGVTSQKVTIMFGIFWAFGYALYTIFNLIWSVLLKEYGFQGATVFYIVMSCLYLICVPMFPETKKK